MRTFFPDSRHFGNTNKPLIMKTFLFSWRCLLVLLGGLLTLPVAQAQTLIGLQGFSTGTPRNAPLAFLPNGQPVVAYSDGAFGGKVVVQRFSAGVWSAVGPPSGISFGTNYVQQVSLVINPGNGDIFVAYAEGPNVFIQRYNGTWTYVGLPLPCGPASEISLALSPTGVPFVAYQSPAGVVVVRRFAAIIWLPVGLPLSVGSSSDPSLVFSPSGTNPFVAFMESGVGITVKRLSAGVWIPVGVSIGSPNSKQPCLAFGPLPFPHVGYQDGQLVKVERYIFGWTPVGPPGFPGRVQTNTWLALSQFGTPVAVYQDGAIKASVRHFTAGSWQILIGPGAFSSGLVEFPALAFRPTDDKLYVSVRDISVSPDRVTVRRTTTFARSQFLQEIVVEEPTAPYPNPVVGWSFYVPVDDASNTRFNLTDLRGVRMPHRSLPESEKLVQVLLETPVPPGVYLLRVDTPEQPARLHKLVINDH